MKVLFAVNNESISESIIKKYQQEYKEIISVKNVYYFNAIIKELQRDKTYDRIIISEDLQPYSNNDYNSIDKFIFEKLDSISDEATNQSGNDIPIILICTDRRTKSEPLLVKLFGIGIYDALLGKDRSITNVCELLAKPRSKKEAKVYYHIDSEDVDYKVENEGDVTEVEIQSIINHYKKLGNNEQKYVESFEHIASQYTDSQLRLIAKFLPLNVKAVLEANSTKYQEVVSFGETPSNSKKLKLDKKENKQYIKAVNIEHKNDQTSNLDIIKDNLNRNKITEPVIIPSAIDKTKIRRTDSQINNIGQENRTVIQPEKIQKIQEIDDILDELPTNEPKVNNEVTDNSFAPITKLETSNVNMTQPQEMEIQNLNEQVPNVENNENNNQNLSEVKTVEVKRGRGRPRKVQPEGVTPIPVVKRGRGRPRKASPEVVESNEQTSILDEIKSNDQTSIMDEIKSNNQTSIMDETKTNNQAPTIDEVKPLEPIQPMEQNITTEPTAPINLFELGEDDEPARPTIQSDNDFVLPGLDDEPVVNQEPQKTSNDVSPFNLFDEQENTSSENIQNLGNGQEIEQIQSRPIDNQQNSTQSQVQNVQPNENYQSLSNLLTREKKIVAFVGTSKNGTSFLVNNIAEMISQKGINTAVLDLTKNRNAYYIYTENEESLRKVAYSCIDNLRSGRAQGIEVHKNLTVYTALPDEEQNINDYNNILQTLIKNYSLVILDCDFETDIGYFKEAQEMYLVQSFDILTIQPLTAFLRNLKAKNVLNPEKLRIVLNKAVRLKSISEKTIIGGMAFYNDPAMSFMTELFNRDLAVYCTIPFEEQAYSKYLEGLVNCKISLNGFSKVFMNALSKLADMVYPLINNNMNKTGNINYNNYNKFPNSMNSTLDKMKNNY